jgi:hypothetical protein
MPQLPRFSSELSTREAGKLPLSRGPRFAQVIHRCAQVFHCGTAGLVTLAWRPMPRLLREQHTMLGVAGRPSQRPNRPSLTGEIARVACARSTCRGGGLQLFRRTLIGRWRALRGHVRSASHHTSLRRCAEHGDASVCRHVCALIMATAHQRRSANTPRKSRSAWTEHARAAYPRHAAGAPMVAASAAHTATRVRRNIPPAAGPSARQGQDLTLAPASSKPVAVT